MNKVGENFYYYRWSHGFRVSEPILRFTGRWQLVDNELMLEVETQEGCLWRSKTKWVGERRIKSTIIHPIMECGKGQRC